MPDAPPSEPAGHRPGAHQPDEGRFRAIQAQDAPWKPFPAFVIVLPGGPLGLAYVDPATDPRNQPSP